MTENTKNKEQVLEELAEAVQQLSAEELKALQHVALGMQLLKAAQQKATA